MIFYFSATGNSKYVAERIAKETNEKIVSIVECLKDNKFNFEIDKSERIGFITPVYFWGLPTVMCDFLDKLQLKNYTQQYTFLVVTYGTTTGQVKNIVKQKLSKNNILLDACFSIKMADTWTPVFDLSDKQKLKRIEDQSDIQIKDMCKLISQNKIGDYSKRKIPKFMVDIYYPTYEKSRNTKFFSVDDSCIGCKLCEKKCPVNAIEIINNKPVWVKEKCTLCLSCLHRCPNFAIQYKEKTRNHGQYLNPYTKI